MLFVDTLGGKGAGLAEMSGAKLPVPPGFTITTEICTYYYDHGKTYPPTLEAEVDAAMAVAVSQADLVVVGADSISADGYLLKD
mgnify:CR=1 FL=1